MLPLKKLSVGKVRRENFADAEQNGTKQSLSSALDELECIRPFSSSFPSAPLPTVGLR